MQELNFSRQELARLSSQRAELEAQRKELLSGMVHITLEEGKTIRMLLPLFSDELEDQKQEEAQTRLLEENELFGLIRTAFQKRHEIARELSLKGAIALPFEDQSQENRSIKLRGSLAGSLTAGNLSLNRRLSGIPLLGRVATSAIWMLLLGLLLMVVWGGGVALDALTGKTSIPPSPSLPTPSPVASTNPVALNKASPGFQKVLLSYRQEEAVTPEVTAGIREEVTPSPLSGNTVTASYSAATATSVQDEIATPEVTAVVAPRDTPSPLPGNIVTLRAETATPLPEEDFSTPAPYMTSTPQPLPETGARVGCPFSPAGGNNGPHGCFFAPSKLDSKAIGLSKPISRATVVEELAVSDDNPTSSDSTQNGATQSNQSDNVGAGSSTSSTSPGGSSISVAAARVGLKILMPPPNADLIAHYGAYPGELGNMLLFGTNTSLALARQWQVGDEVVFTDRKGNLFTYRIVSFSPTGQPERLIDLSDPSDAWVFEPEAGSAIATFILPTAQLLPVSSSVSGSSAGSGAAYGVGSEPASKLVDDPSSTRRYAYRAVLSLYNPAKTTPAGSKVMVPEEVWKTRGAALNQRLTPKPGDTATSPVVSPSPSISPVASSSSPVATGVSLSPASTTQPLPTATVNASGSGAYPNLPDTGKSFDSAETNTAGSKPALETLVIALSSCFLLALTGLVLFKHRPGLFISISKFSGRSRNSYVHNELFSQTEPLRAEPAATVSATTAGTVPDALYPVAGGSPGADNGDGRFHGGSSNH